MLKKLTAAVIAASTAIIPFSADTVNILSKTNVHAEETANAASILDWIPKDLKSALEFRNTYGATHIGEQNECDLLCVVFQEQHYSTKKYAIKNTAALPTEYYHNVFVDEENDTAYEVMAYKNAATSKPDFKIQFSCDSELQKEYTFTSFGTQIAETDIYSWLPDCEKEYWDFADKNSHLSVKDNYVVFCLSHEEGSNYNWFLKDDGKECFELETVSDCTSEVGTGSDLPLIARNNMIYAYKAVKDGYDKIAYYFGEAHASIEEESKTLSADCIVLDNAQTVLLSGDMRITLVDYDTGEQLSFTEDEAPSVWTDIFIDTVIEGRISMNMEPCRLFKNPSIVGLGRFFNGYNFSFGLNGPPKGYSLPATEGRHPGYYNGTVVPDDYMSVKQYDNGTADVMFRLKKKSASEKPAKITFYDADTGELIDDPRYDEDFHLLKCKKDDPSESERFGFTSNPCTIVSGYLFDESCTCSFHFNTRYGQYDSIELNTISDDAECTELTCRMKWTPSGDANRDGSFSIADLVLLQEWLQGQKNTRLYDWKTVDYCRDNSIDVFDLVLMRKALIKSVKLPVAITINEKGGYDDVNKTYKVYRENNRYLLYYDEIKKDMDIEPLYMEISKQDYRDIMSQDYNRLIENYKDLITPAPNEIEYTSVLTYSDGSKAETKAYMADIVYKLDTLIDEYLSGKNAFVDVMPDYRVPYGSPFIVIEDGLTLYSGPGKGYRTIDTIFKGERLFEIGYNKNNDTWLFTEYNGKNGWIKIVKDDNETPTIRYEVYPDKPVIYLYPEEETDVHVELVLTEAELSTTYPKYNNGWDVTASPDGSLLNKADGSHHKYLFWDAVNCRTRFDFSKGFCVAGSDTESFLKEKLTYMGLTEEEMNEFIVYWLPLMEHNKYNLISFQGDVYTNSAKLNITPAPDSLLRIFMTYIPLEEAVDIEPQQLETFDRNGFTVVEWGGSEIRS